MFVTHFTGDKWVENSIATILFLVHLNIKLIYFSKKICFLLFICEPEKLYELYDR